MKGFPSSKTGGSIYSHAVMHRHALWFCLTGGSMVLPSGFKKYEKTVFPMCLNSKNKNRNLQTL